MGTSVAGLCSGCGSGHSLGRQLESPCLGEALAEEGASGHCLGDREPRPGRGGKGRVQGLDTGGLLHQMCAPPFPPLLVTGLMGHLSAPPLACPSRLRGIWRPFANHPSSDSSPLGIFFKHKTYFLRV